MLSTLTAWLQGLRADRGARQRVIIGGFVVVVTLGAAWMLRYQVVPINHTRNAYYLDRWTGEVYVLAGGRMIPISGKEAKKRQSVSSEPAYPAYLR